MSKNASNVRVALTGNVWYDPNLESIITTDIMDPPTATATELGYTTPDGVTFQVSRETEDLDAWQTKDVLRILVNSEVAGCNYTLRQTERGTWIAAMGGTVVELVAAAGGDPAIYRWEPDEGKLPEGRVFVDFDDELPDGTPVRYRFGFRRAANSEAVEFQLVRTDALNLPNNWRALAPLAGGRSFYMDTNDPAFGPTTGVPVIASALPSGQAVGDALMLTGTRFTGTTGITIDGQTVTNQDVISDSQIALVIPSGVAGAASIIVTNASGASAAYAYTAA